MDPRTGELYRLEDVGEAGDVQKAKDAKAADADSEARLKALVAEDAERALVAVEGDVVQKLRLGEKELQRRQRRSRHA